MRTKTSRRKALVLAVLPAVAAAGITLLTGSSASAAPGFTITPTSGGQDIEPITVSTPAACPEGSTDFIVQISGGGFPEGSNMIGLNPLPDPSAPVTNFPAGGTWNTIAANNGAPTPLNGLATMTFICVADGAPAETYTGDVQFNSTGSTFELVSAPTPTPDVPTPTPDVPTPTPDVPTPTPDVPTPTPDVPTPTPDPGGDVLDTEEQDITVSVPVIEAGNFTLTIDPNDTVPMSEAAPSGDFLSSTGNLNDIVVTDTRQNNSGLGYEWTLNGLVSEFIGADPANSFSSQFLGWEPSFADNGTAGTAGPTVAPGFPTGEGLSVSQVLASAVPATTPGDGTADAALTLNIPADTPADTYTATLTLTALG